MTHSLLRMEAIFNVSFLMLCMVLSQVLVVASRGIIELSSVPHIRQKRMDYSPPPRLGSLQSHQLPPFLAYDLRAVNMDAPTVVVITRNSSFSGTGYAIHPYLVLTRSVYVRPHYVYGVSTHNRYAGGLIPQRVGHRHPNPSGEFVMIQLKDPISLDNAKPGAFPAARFPVSATNWACHMALQWIPRQLLHLRPLLRQNLNEIHFMDPTRVHVTSSGRPDPGNGYAVHPYVVITRPQFVDENSRVLSSMAPAGEPKPHRIQFRYLNRDLNVEVLELVDPIFLANGETGALAAEQYSAPAIAWAHNRVEEWKHTRLLQPNFYQQNAA